MAYTAPVMIRLMPDIALTCSSNDTGSAGNDIYNTGNSTYMLKQRHRQCRQRYIQCRQRHLHAQATIWAVSATIPTMPATVFTCPEMQTHNSETPSAYAILSADRHEGAVDTLIGYGACL
jgi:hypothetical protein